MEISVVAGVGNLAEICMFATVYNFSLVIIEYKDNKEVECYRNFVLNPEDRKASRQFSKMFRQNLMNAAKKLHERLEAYESAGAYNAVFGNSDNRIELKQGGKDNQPLILKVRVDRSYRKFFNQKTDAQDTMLLTRDWKGEFSSVTTIYVVAVNNHDYNNV